MSVLQKYDKCKQVVRVHDFSSTGAGMELSYYPQVPPGGWASSVDSQAKTSLHEMTPQERAERQRKNSQRSVRRARKEVRQAVKTLETAYFWTLTYGSAGEFQRSYVVADWERFTQLLKDAVGEVRYIAVPELQKRGSWHIHFICDVYIPVELVDRLWKQACCPVRAGYVFVRGPQRGWSPVAAANYLCKYFSKDMDDSEREDAVPLLLGDRRYWISQGFSIPTEDFVFSGWREREAFVRALIANFEDVWRYHEGLHGTVICSNIVSLQAADG